jgi:mitotic spindle assembly checkpoint protein MAD1
MTEMRATLDNLQRQFDTLSESHDVLEKAARKANRISKDAQTQLMSVQEENEYNHAEAAKYRQLVQEKEEELEALRVSMRTGRGPAVPVDSGRDSKEWDALRSQLLQQTEEMRRLEDANGKMKAELLVMKERYTNVEVLKEEKRVLERRVRDTDTLREQLGMMEAQVDALRQESEQS